MPDKKDIATFIIGGTFTLAGSILGVVTNITDNVLSVIGEAAGTAVKEKNDNESGSDEFRSSDKTEQH